MNEQITRAAAWRKLEYRTARKVNLAWCVQIAGPVLVVAGAAGFEGILWSRSRIGFIAPVSVIPWVIVALVGVLGVSFLLVRKHS